MTENSITPTAMRVHGAFADASGFAGIIRELSAKGYGVVAPPNPLRGVGFDAATVRATAAAIEGPVALVGHSYGGAVMTEAAEGLDDLAGLVYLAAFAPAVGETVASVQKSFDPPLLAGAIRPTPQNAVGAVGAVGGSDLVIDRGAFGETFAADLDGDLANIMAASQRPLAAVATAEPLSFAGWTEVPTWHVVSTADNAISPDAQQFMAHRMGTTTKKIAGSHSAFTLQPTLFAGIIADALDAAA